MDQILSQMTALLDERFSSLSEAEIEAAAGFEQEPVSYQLMVDGELETHCIVFRFNALGETNKKSLLKLNVILLALETACREADADFGAFFEDKSRVDAVDANILFFPEAGESKPDPFYSSPERSAPDVAVALNIPSDAAFEIVSELWRFLPKFDLGEGRSDAVCKSHILHLNRFASEHGGVNSATAILNQALKSNKA